MQTTKIKLLYTAYSVFSNFYFANRTLKTCFNWIAGNLCASPPGIFAYKYLQKKFLSFPLRVQIETTSYCNAKCIMCPHSKMPRRNQHMEQGLYEKIITELAEHRQELKVLSLHFIGEPLMDPLIFDRIKFAKNAGINVVQFNTNTQLLTQEKARLLLESGIDTITFSLGGLEKETQEERRIGTLSHVVEQNIDYVLELINSYGNDRKKTKTFIYTIKNSSQDKAYLPIIKKYKNKVDGIVVVNQNNWGGDAKNHEKEIRLTRYLVPCPYIFTEMLINVNGKVNLCCLDYADKAILGDVATSSLYDIWNGKKMEDYRLLHLKKKSDRIQLCSECTLFR